MSDHDLSKDPQAMNISTEDTHLFVQCSRVNLIHSILEPLENYQELEVSQFLFKIGITVDRLTAFSHLHVQVSALSDTPDLSGCSLKFTLLGIFRAEEKMSQEALGDFARYYTLSILWPYAREYTADQLRRAGLPFNSLPIINPQIVTEQLIESNLVQVEIHSGIE